ncbi:hypothetical protein CBOM_07922 [Ceraceosorus bombacis]|uniref:Uncharacterized protein n=1 Tax=Ceraceosorus bombacis TaxID=401625 RepID=A0A0P1BS84_9BASI|nr:hypothetical protein CBOM_07922 [Ceraceosorus bombacis]
MQDQEDQAPTRLSQATSSNNDCSPAAAGSMVLDCQPVRLLLTLIIRPRSYPPRRSRASQHEQANKNFTVNASASPSSRKYEATTSAANLTSSR